LGGNGKTGTDGDFFVTVYPRNWKRLKEEEEVIPTWQTYKLVNWGHYQHHLCRVLNLCMVIELRKRLFKESRTSHLCEISICLSV
jgi:hypothetical protein